jgi:hypothetical protein
MLQWPLLIQMVHNQMRARFGKAPLSQQDYNNTPQLMYKADVVTLWVNVSERDSNGLIIQERRQKISSQDLLS